MTDSTASATRYGQSARLAQQQLVTGAVVHLQGPADFAGWKDACRGLLVAGVAPHEVSWQVATDLSTPEIATGSASPGQSPISVPEEFAKLARAALCHSSEDRFGLLYRLLWRLQRENRRLMADESDPDVNRAARWAKAVRRDVHKMKAFVRFREDPTTDEDAEHFVAWFEPDHFIVEYAADFFRRRFTNMSWSILTPYRCAHWTDATLWFSGGVAREAAPAADAIEDFWRTYYRNIFNPARLKLDAMRSEMPQKYWHNLPEAREITALSGEAAGRSQGMIDADATTPAPMVHAVAVGRERESKVESESFGDDIGLLRRQAAHCRGCDLWQNATQTVFGEGPGDAQIMLVGEQPGDQEDLRGQPFVGPAGKVLDAALERAGLDRERLYVTNSVKHFKFLVRGKRRLHQKPDAEEVRACSNWLRAEMDSVRPKVVVCLGATAAQAVYGRTVRIMRERSEIRALEGSVLSVITVHPSYLLRLPDEQAKRTEFGRFVADLKLALDACK